MMNIYNYVKMYAQAYRHIIIATCLIVCGVFLAIALLSFNATDSSWFYYATMPTAIQNKAGIVGAYCAALCFYLVGGASLLCAALLFFISYLFIMQRSLDRHWERIIAGCYLIVIYAALLHVHAIDFLSPTYAGGTIGQRCIYFLYQWFDDFTLVLFLYVSCIAAAIILFRISAVELLLCIKRYVVRLWSYDTWHSLYYYLRACAKKWYKGKETVHEVDIISYAFEDDEKEQAAIAAHQTKALKDTVERKKRPDTVARETAEHATEQKKNIPVFQSRAEKLIADRPVVRDSYRLPNLEIFVIKKETFDGDEQLQHLQERAQLLEQKLERFGVAGRVVSIKQGPVVTLFEYRPDIDSKISKITALEDDLALALQALSIRIIAPIPGKPFVGFEVSNKKRRHVSLAQLLRSESFAQFSGILPIALGQDTIGNNVTVDLVGMPHLLIAGSTGSGKSVALNTLLVSLLCKLTPDELRIILIDPKRLEFASYADIAHLLFPIVTQPKKAAPVLRWVVQQMEERYELIAQHGARNLQDFNALMVKEGKSKLPFIVIIIDELADLMMTAGREIEDLIARITQMARAAGIHLIVATQRPSVDVITGLIKVNFPSRISFRVTSKIDSRTILDCNGADKLLGRGDMLFLDSQDATLKRLHGAYVSDEEIDKLVVHIKSQREVEYLEFDEQTEIADSDDRDDMYELVLDYLEEIDEISISLLQRKFRIGYNRSARIIDMLEAEGLIGPSGNGKTRSVMK